MLAGNPDMLNLPDSMVAEEHLLQLAKSRVEVVSEKSMRKLVALV